MAVKQVQARFGSMVQRIEWSAARAQVKLFGTGFAVDMGVDAQEVQMSFDLAFLGKPLGWPLVGGLKAIVHQTFRKQLE